MVVLLNELKGICNHKALFLAVQKLPKKLFFQFLLERIDFHRLHYFVLSDIRQQQFTLAAHHILHMLGIYI